MKPDAAEGLAIVPPPIPVCEDGAPLKRARQVRVRQVRAPIPVCEDGAPLKRYPSPPVELGQRIDPRLRRRGPVEANLDGQELEIVFPTIPVCEDGAPLKPLEKAGWKVDWFSDPRLRRRGPVEAAIAHPAFNRLVCDPRLRRRGPVEATQPWPMTSWRFPRSPSAKTGPR